MDGSSDENEQFIQRITLMNNADDVTKGFTKNMALKSRVIGTTEWEKRLCLVKICVRALRLSFMQLFFKKKKYKGNLNQLNKLWKTAIILINN